MKPPGPGLLWYRTSLTLASPLTPEEVRERLAKALPRFDVYTGRPVPVPGFGWLFRTTYSGRLKPESFLLSGPTSAQRMAVLTVKGSVEATPQGSLVHLTASNVGALGVAIVTWTVGPLGVFFGVVLPDARSAHDVLVGALAAGLFVVPVCGILGGLFFLWVSWRARAALGELVACLEKMFKAQRSR